MSAPEREIGGAVFTVSPLPAMRSFLLQPRIAPVLAEAGAILAEVAAGDADVLDLDVLELAPRILPRVGQIFAKLPPEELRAITRELLEGATMDGVLLFTGAGDPFDVKLRGRTLDVWRLLWFALEVNYPDFFGALAASRSAGAVKAGPSAASNT